MDLKFGFLRGTKEALGSINDYLRRPASVSRFKKKLKTTTRKKKASKTIHFSWNQKNTTDVVWIRP